MYKRLKNNFDVLKKVFPELSILLRNQDVFNLKCHSYFGLKVFGQKSSMQPQLDCNAI